MLSHVPGTPAVIRDMNRYAILNVIEEKGPISRAEVSRITGLSLPTVSGATDYLLKCGLVKEVGPGESSGGRKPQLLEFNPEAGYVLGIDLGGTSVAIVLSRLDGKIARRQVGPPISPELGSHIDDGLLPYVSSVVESIDPGAGRVLGIGISAPGAVDPETGRVSLAPALGWVDFPLGELLASRFHMPVVVENDVNAAAFGEKLLGIGKDYRDFVFVFIGTGIGAGIILEDKLYRGYGNLAGEIGYLVVDKFWTPNSTLSFGCLEALASERAILQQVDPDLQQAGPGNLPKDTVCHEVPGGVRGTTIEKVLLAAARGEKAAKKVIADASLHLAVGICNLTCVLSPEAIILGGITCSRGGEYLVDLIQERLRSITPRMPGIFVSSLGRDASLVGATLLAARAVKERLVDEGE